MLEKQFQKTKVIPRLSRISFLEVQFVQNESDSEDIAVGHQRKLQGQTPGHADLIVYDTKRNIIDFIELKGYKEGKRKKYIAMGDQSPNQVIFENMVNSMGHDYYLIRNPDELQAYIDMKLDT